MTVISFNDDAKLGCNFAKQSCCESIITTSVRYCTKNNMKMKHNHINKRVRIPSLSSSSYVQELKCSGLSNHTPSNQSQQNQLNNLPECKHSGDLAPPYARSPQPEQHPRLTPCLSCPCHQWRVCAWFCCLSTNMRSPSYIR